MTYDTLKALIERRGVHAEFGAAGEGWAIEQNPHELATFLVAMLSLGVQSCLEIGTGYKGGLSRFLAAELGWRVTSVDVVDYGHKFAGVEYVVGKSYDLPWEHGKYDLIFIDGDHSRYGVGRDSGFAVFQGAKVVAFHDICGLRNCGGVTEVWRNHAYFNNRMVQGHYEIIDDSARRSGIGYYVLEDMGHFSSLTPISKEEFLRAMENDIDE